LKNIWIKRRQPLRITKIHEYESDTFVPKDILINKGLRSVKVCSLALKDLRAVGGLNPAVEMAYCVKQELEDTLSAAWGQGHSQPKTLLKRKDLVRIATLFEAIRRDLPWEDLLDD
jgi:hypothetical protein